METESYLGKIKDASDLVARNAAMMLELERLEELYQKAKRYGADSLECQIGMASYSYPLDKLPMSWYERRQVFKGWVDENLS